MGVSIYYVFCALFLLIAFHFLVYKNLKKCKCFVAEKSEMKSFLETSMGIVCFLGLYFVIKYVENAILVIALSVLWMGLLLWIDILLFRTNMLVFRTNEIICPFRWKLSRENIEAWSIDKEKRTLFLSSQKGKSLYRFDHIKKEDIESLYNELEKSQHIYRSQ
jgi:hypothetical protein